MSFSFSGAGPRADVVRQVRSHHGYDTDQFAVVVRDFIAGLLEDLGEDPSPRGGQYVYTVQASGHAGDGPPVALNIAITPAWVPPLDMLEEAAPAAAAEIAGQQAIGEFI